MLASCHLSKTAIMTRCLAGAGLGGGSGNAATTLWAANELCDRPASNLELLEWAGEIGSDISVFFSTGAAYCTGRCAFHTSPRSTKAHSSIMGTRGCITAKCKITLPYSSQDYTCQEKPHKSRRESRLSLAQHEVSLNG